MILSEFLSVGKKQQEKERFTVLPKICAMPVEIGRRTREFPVEPETYSNEGWAGCYGNLSDPGVSHSGSGADDPLEDQCQGGKMMVKEFQSSSWMCGMYQTLAFGCSERFQKAGAYDGDLCFTFQDSGRRTLYARCGMV